MLHRASSTLVTLLVFVSQLQLSARAEDLCTYSTAGFPGDAFAAEVTYDRLDEQRLRLTVVVQGIEGAYSAELALYYGVSAAFSAAYEALAERSFAFTGKLQLNESDEGELLAEMALSRDYPHLAFVLTLQEGDGTTSYCGDRYVALVLEGSAPPNERSGRLARFRYVAAH